VTTNKQTKVTQVLIYQELQNIGKTLTEHTLADSTNFGEMRRLLEGSDASPGIKMRVDRIEQSEITKRRHFQYLWGVISALVVAMIVSLLKLR
jgi:hypothetical protein